MIPLTPATLLGSQIIAHLALLYWLFNDPKMSDLLAITFMYFLTGCLGMSVTYHRLLTHRSFRCSKIVEQLGSILATLGLTGSSLSWTAAHRQHHSRADQAGDPHGPGVLGYFSAQYLSMFSRIEVRRSPVIRSRFHQIIHRHYFTVNILYSLLLFLLGGLEYVLIFHLVPAAILWNAGSLINTVCHTRALGYRRYNLADNSVNNPILGILMWGEGWHNNHHRFQTNPDLGQKWWEIDIGYYFIKLLRQS